MIKFETINGKLFRMLEEHEIVPLKENDANVLVRFITHGIIGEYVMEHWLDCNQKNVPIFVKDVDSDGDVTVCIENGNEHICCPFPMFEIIGTPVAEGSAEWAMYQMMQGKKVCNPTLAAEKSTRLGSYEVEQFNTYWYVVGEIVVEGEANYGALSVLSWISAAHPYGWQIYEPKPLLADAKVGDLCKRMDGKWVQIDAIRNNGNKLSIFEAEGRSYYESGNAVCSELYHTKFDIIHTEPLAPEGSAEWAVQRMKLGDKVTKRHLSHTYWQYDARHHLKCISEYNCGTLQIMVSPEIWIKTAEPTGWQIYKEPEPQYKVGDWVKYDIDSYLQVVEPSGKERTLCRTLSGTMVYPCTSCLTKASPSEVIVKIGCLSGTIKKSCDNAYFSMRHSSPDRDRNYSVIKFSALDKETRELVKSLLKAQEEEK